MQVINSAPFSSSTAEPVSSSGKPAASSSESAFSLQMDEVFNSESVPESDAGKSDNVPNAPAENFLTKNFGASFVRGNPDLGAAAAKPGKSDGSGDKPAKSASAPQDADPLIAYLLQGAAPKFNDQWSAEPIPAFPDSTATTLQEVAFPMPPSAENTVVEGESLFRIDEQYSSPRVSSSADQPVSAEPPEEKLSLPLQLPLRLLEESNSRKSGVKEEQRGIPKGQSDTASAIAQKDETAGQQAPAGLISPALNPADESGADPEGDASLERVRVSGSARRREFMTRSGQPGEAVNTPVHEISTDAISSLRIENRNPESTPGKSGWLGPSAAGSEIGKAGNRQGAAAPVTTTESGERFLTTRPAAEIYISRQGGEQAENGTRLPAAISLDLPQQTENAVEAQAKSQNSAETKVEQSWNAYVRRQASIGPVSENPMETRTQAPFTEAIELNTEPMGEAQTGMGIADQASGRSLRTGNLVIEGFQSSIPSAEKRDSQKRSDLKTDVGKPEVPQSNKETSRFEATPAETRPGTFIRAEWYPANEKPVPEQNMQFADESGATEELTAGQKQEGIRAAVSENAGNPESRAGRESSQVDSASTTAQQNKSENSRIDFGKLHNSSADRQQEVSMQSQLSATPGITEVGRNTPEKLPVVNAQSRDFVSDLAERIQVQVRDGKGEIRIQLKPDSLGHLEIRAESTANGVVAHILAESSGVKNYLEGNMHVLQQSLQDQGLKVDRIQVTVQDHYGSSSSSGYPAQSGHAGSGSNGREGSRFSENPGSFTASHAEELNTDPATWTDRNPNARFHRIA